MEFSAQSILYLQRLARIVKKELNMTVSISRYSSITDLVRRALSEQDNKAVIEARTQFLLTLSESEKQELATIVPMHTIEPDVQAQPKRATSYDRRQRHVHIDHDRRRKSTVYRGNTVVYDRRQQDIPFEGEDRRGKGIHQGGSQGEPSQKEALKDTKKQMIYRGQKIE